MKKKYTYIILLIVFSVLTAFVVIKYKVKQSNKELVNYHLKNRQGPAANLPEWAETKTKTENLLKNLAVNPEDVKSKIALAGLYIQEARITGDYIYYDAAAMKYIDEILIKNPQHFEGLLLKSMLQLSQHHFSEALETAAIAQKINPYNAFVYGIMVDGNVEMGNYTKAVECSDKMMSIRPDIRSYSRVSYLREIHGDLSGAIEAMKMAVDAGGYGDEGTAWARIQLARLYEIAGELKAAEMHYSIILNERPGFGYALAGMGNIYMSQKNYPLAIAYYKKADSAIIDYSIKEQLATLYLLNNQTDSANAHFDIVINDLKKASAKGEDVINHHADKELAYVYLMNNNADKALKHAMAEYNRRPDNIDVNEAVAWTYYKIGDYASARPYLKNALKTNSKNPSLLCRAGIISFALGDNKKAKSFLQEALKLNPNFDPILKNESEQVLSKLNN